MSTAPKIASADYEPRDASVRLVVGSVALLALGIALCFGTAALLDHGAGRPGRRMDPAMVFRHGATEESSIARDWRAEDAAVRDHLENYAWVDRGAGIVRIPVERAMELMVSDAAAAANASPDPQANIVHATANIQP